MVRPIEATPVFDGQDAIDLLDTLEKVRPSSEERQRRVREGRKRIDELQRPKGFRGRVR